MRTKIEKFNYANKLSEYFKRVESSKWYMVYIQELLLQDIEKKEPDIRRMLNENKELENRHKGKRCFILGNGPSLNNIDFKKLSNEIVFTVNQLPEHPLFQELQSNYHVITDLQAFGLRYARDKLTPGFTKYSLNLIKSLAQKGKPTLIVPYQTKKILQRTGITEILKIKYICQYKEFIDGYQSSDLTKPVSNFPGVTLTAILCAIYMGIAEIYLLGCEQTAIIDVLECALGNKIKYGHAYAEKEKDSMEETGYRILADSRGIKIYLRCEYVIHETFEQLNHYCRKKGVHLYNLTVPTLVSGIPKRSFDEVIQKS